MDSIKKLQDIFSKFPTVGQRTAGRFVFYLLSLPKESLDELIKAIQAAKDRVKFCRFCFDPHEETQDICAICQNPSRSKEMLCVVEKETDLLSIENTKKYKGLYFILGASASLFKKGLQEKIRTLELRERIQNPEKFGLSGAKFSEVIIATNPTPEGRATTVLVERAIKELPTRAFKVTRLARGLPVGGELEYADEETLESAFEGRK